MNHIKITCDADCCGCGACAAACPVDCIEMTANAEGFLYPEVYTDRCTECGLCVKICPWLNEPEVSQRIAPLKVYAAWHLNDNIRSQSSSGGVFTALADTVLTRDGVVVGAAFDENMTCRHILVEDAAGLNKQRGSKYVQSEMPPALFGHIRKLLVERRYVLFTGTPCQVAGLRNGLGKEYNSLICCDLICHGVPSPGWYRKYIAELQRDARTVTSFEFRNKKTGWKDFGVKIKWSDGKSKFDSMHGNPYMASFLKDYALRESCYVCKFTTTVRQGDLTIADYWKVATKYPEYDTEDKGTSLVLVNSHKGQAWLNRCKDKLFIGGGDLEHAISGNPMLVRPAARPTSRDTFYKHMEVMTVQQLRREYQLHPRPLWKRVLGAAKHRLKQLLIASPKE